MTRLLGTFAPPPRRARQRERQREPVLGFARALRRSLREHFIHRHRPRDDFDSRNERLAERKIRHGVILAGARLRGLARAGGQGGEEAQRPETSNEREHDEERDDARTRAGRVLP